MAPRTGNISRRIVTSSIATDNNLKSAQPSTTTNKINLSLRPIGSIHSSQNQELRTVYHSTSNFNHERTT